MSAKTASKLFVLIAFIIALSSFVSGQDFEAYTGFSKVSLCKGELFDYKVNIEPKFSDEKVFAVTQENKELKSAINFVPENFVVSSENEEVRAFVNTRDLDPKTYNSRILLEAGGVKKEIKQEIEVNNCVNQQINFRRNSYTNCPCVPTVYEFNITNIGRFTDTFNLALDTKDSYYTLTESSLRLSPYETSTVYLFIKMPCDNVGNYSFNLLAESEASGVVKTYPVLLRIRKDCYEFDFGLGQFLRTAGNVTPQENFTFPFNDTYNMCINNTYRLPFNITNRGEFNNTYNISSDSPSLINISYTNNTLDINETLSGAIEVQTRNISQGSYKTILEITTDKGDFSKSYTLDFYADDCRIDDHGFQKEFWWLIAGLLILLFIIFVIALLILHRSSEKEDEVKKLSKKEKTSAKNFWPVLFIVIILLLLVLFGFYFSGTITHSGGNETANESVNLTQNITGGGNRGLINQTNQSAEPEGDLGNFIDLYKYYIIAGIVLLALIIILLSFKPQIFSKNYMPFIIVLILVAVFLIVVFFVLYVWSGEKGQIEETLEENSTSYIMAKNTVRVIDFSEHINSSGEFELSATPMQNISVNISETKVRLEPDEGWYGRDVFNLIATGSGGATSYSPDINVVVIDREPWHIELWQNTKSFFSDYLLSIVLVLLVISVLAFLIYRQK